jgi:hypothetical protein
MSELIEFRAGALSRVVQLPEWHFDHHDEGEADIDEETALRLHGWELLAEWQPKGPFQRRCDCGRCGGGPFVVEVWQRGAVCFAQFYNSHNMLWGVTFASAELPAFADKYSLVDEAMWDEFWAAQI